MVMMGFVAGQHACGRSGCSKALDSIALGLRQGTTPQAASRPAPSRSHRNHKVRYRLPLERAPAAGEGWFLAQSLINGICAGLIRRPEGWPPYRDYQQRPVIYTLLRGVGDAAPYGIARYIAIFFNCVLFPVFRQGGVPTLLAWQIFHRTYAHKYKNAAADCYICCGISI